MSKTKLDEQIQEIEQPSLFVEKIGATEKEIEDETRRDDAELEKQKKHTVHQGWTWLIYTAIACCILAMSVLTLNYLLPHHLCWLTEEKLNFLTTSFLSSLVGYMLKSTQKYI